MRLLATSLLCLIPVDLWACAVCVGGNEENRQAFIFTTVLLTLIPLIVIGSLVRWAQRRSEERDAEQERLSQQYQNANPKLN